MGQPTKLETYVEASTASRELIHCGCKKGCTGCCRCKKAAFKCTALCQCSGEHKISSLNMNFKFNELLIVNSLHQSIKKLSITLDQNKIKSLFKFQITFYNKSFNLISNMTTFDKN